MYLLLIAVLKSRESVLGPVVDLDARLLAKNP